MLFRCCSARLFSLFFHSNTNFNRPVCALLFISASLFPGLAHAQDNYEIQVYGSDLVDSGRTMIELHSNFTIDGSKTTVNGVYPTNHAEHETVEITHGFTDYFECGFYIFSSITEGQDWQ